ncbi:hypothetical protein Tco_1234282 [Tanacetum coccineum]
MGPQSISTAHLCAIDKDCEDFEGPILAQLQPISTPYTPSMAESDARQSKGWELCEDLPTLHSKHFP